MTLLLSNTRQSYDDAQTEYERRRMPPDAFEIYLDDDRYAVPTLHLVVADDPAMAYVMAERLMADSPHHLGAEICLEGRRLAGLGSYATRQLPPDIPTRKAD